MIVLAIMAAALSPESPAIFVQRLYANYRNSNYSPLSHPQRVFAPRLLLAIREDERLADGEVGFLDGDPLCDCQDTGGMRVKIGSVAARGDRATSRVAILFAPSERRDVRLKLVRIGINWRIADVATPDEPSLLKDLEESNRKSSRR